MDPNSDGSYTSPGDGWIEFIPTAKNPSLLVFNADHSRVYYFGEEPDGGPRGYALDAGGVADETIVIWSFFPARSNCSGRLGRWGRKAVGEIPS